MVGQDLLALSHKYNTRPAAEETINDPTVRRHYWRYRCHVTLESILADSDFLDNIRSLLSGGYRFDLRIELPTCCHAVFGHSFCLATEVVHIMYAAL